MKKTIIEREWGFVYIEISNYHFDFLPRLTVTDARYMLEVNAGFLCFRAWLTIFSDEMREINRRDR